MGLRTDWEQIGMDQMKRDYIAKGSRSYYMAILALFLGSLANFGLTYSIQPLLPKISNAFGLLPSTASLAMSMTTGSMAIGLLLIAGVAGMLERKKTIVASLIGSAVLMIGASMSSDFTSILVCRALQGLFIAGFPAIAIAYINEEFDPRTIGFVIGIYIGSNSIGGLLGRIVTSSVADMYDWHIGLGSISVLGLVLALWVLFTLPRSVNFAPSKHCPKNFVRSIFDNFKNRHLVEIYFVAFCVMGCFMAMYNFLPYVLVQPPYSFTQTQVGLIYAMYLIGSFASAYMGKRADLCGHGKVLCISFLLTFVGVLGTVPSSLWCKMAGLAVFTFGFFGAHTAACSWVGSVCGGDKAQAVSLYLLCYYVGASIIGTLTGVPYQTYGWEGAAATMCAVLGIGGMVAFHLWRELDRRA